MDGEHVYISRFFGSNLRILPVRNNHDIIKGMLTISRVRIILSSLAYLLKYWSAGSKPNRYSWIDYYDFI